jgi:hypothetical protein
VLVENFYQSPEFLEKLQAVAKKNPDLPVSMIEDILIGLDQVSANQTTIYPFESDLT